MESVSATYLHITERLAFPPLSFGDVCAKALAAIFLPVGLAWAGVVAYQERMFYQRLVVAINDCFKDADVPSEMREGLYKTVDKIARFATYLLHSAETDCFIPIGSVVRCEASWFEATRYIASPCDVIKQGGRVYIISPYPLDNTGATKTVFPVLEVNDSFFSQKVAHVPSIERPGKKEQLTLAINRESISLLKHASPDTVDKYDKIMSVADRFWFLQNRYDGNLRSIVRKLAEVEKYQLPSIVLTALISTCRCLRNVHDKGDVHSDVKMMNILVNKTGEGKLADFGECISVVDAKERSRKVKIALESECNVEDLVKSLNGKTWFLALSREVKDASPSGEVWYPSTASFKAKVIESGALTRDKVSEIEEAFKEGRDCSSLCTTDEAKFLLFLLKFDKLTIRGSLDHISPVYYIRRYQGPDTDKYAFKVTIQDARSMIVENGQTIVGTNTSLLLDLIEEELDRDGDLEKVQRALEKILSAQNSVEDIKEEEVVL